MINCKLIGQRFFAPLLIFVFMLLPAHALAAEDNGSDFVVFFSGNTIGELDSCG